MRSRGWPSGHGDLEARHRLAACGRQIRRAGSYGGFMEFIGMFEKLRALPQFSNKRSRNRDGLRASAREVAATVLPGRTRMFCNRLIAMLIASVLLAGSAAAQEHAAPASAPNQEAAHYAWADVLRVDPVYDEVAQTAPREECYEEQVIE